jgi:ornithine carbamoyltransferase
MPRHYLSQNDLSLVEIDRILDDAASLRSQPRSARLSGRCMVMFFEKTSTRTRLSFEIGMAQLGGHAVYLDRDSSQLSRGESIRDTALVVSRYADIMMARVFAHETVVELARYATIPVINGLSDAEHPAQTLSDLLTIRDHKGRLAGVNVAYVGDGMNNVTHSLLLACSRVGANIAVASPPELAPSPHFVELARENAAGAGTRVLVTTDPDEAVGGADVVYTDVWISMGREAEREERLRLLRPYQVNSKLLEHAKDDCIFMHCLPQHIGDEVTADVAYGDRSVIFDQAESRLHVQKALILFLLEGATSNG